MSQPFLYYMTSMHNCRVPTNMCDVSFNVTVNERPKYSDELNVEKYGTLFLPVGDRKIKIT